MDNKRIPVAITDDHNLLRNGLAMLIESYGDYEIVYQAEHGLSLINQIREKKVMPRIVLMDINMPIMDGLETTAWFKANHPDVTVVALTMLDNEQSVIRMMRNGAKGFILKDSSPVALRNALDILAEQGFYYSEKIANKLVQVVKQSPVPDLNEKELEFLKLACSEKTYKEIAMMMSLSPRTIDGYRDSLFEKLNLKTRVGLVMYAFRNEIVLVN